MRVLAIDPGPTESAYVLWDGKQILSSGKALNAEVGVIVGQLATDPHERADCIAIEQIAGSYGQNAGMEIMNTAHWSGRFAQRWATHRGDATLTMVPRKTVVTHICGHAKGNDSNVRCALIDRVGPQGSKKQPGPTFGVAGDVWAALAVAVTIYDRMNL